MGVRRILIFVTSVILVIIALSLYSYVQHLSPPPPDPLDTGKRAVRVTDLPADLQGQDTVRLKERLAELVAQGQGKNPENWWSTRLELAECREARVLAVYLGEDRTAVRSLLWLVHKLQYDEQLNTALAILDTADAESRRGGFPAEQAQCAKQRSDCLEWLGLYDIAIEADQRALELYTELDDPRQITTVLFSLARLYSHRRSDHVIALEYYARCLEYVNRVDPARMCHYAALQGFTLQDCGRYPESVDAFRQAVELARGSAEPRLELMELNSMAAAELILNMQAAGEAVLTQSMELGPGIENASWPFEAHRSMAEYQFLVGEHQAAIELLQNTLNRIDECEQSIDPATERAGHLKDTLRTERIAVLASLGNLYLQQKDYAQALDCFLAADALVDHDGFVMPAERMGLNLARAYIGLEQYSDAISVLEAVREDGPAWLGEDADQDDPRVVSLLAEAYLDDGNYEEAARCIEATAAALWPVESEYWLRQRANLLRLQAALAISRDNDADRRNALLDEALACLVSAGKLYPWDSAYRKDLAAEIHRVIDQRLEQTDGSPEPQLVIELGRIADLADRALALEFTPLPAEPDAAAQALVDYRTTTRHLVNLRSDLHWSLGAPASQPWRIYLDRTDLDWRYRRELIRQTAALRCEMQTRNAALEQLAAEQFAELERLDPETAAIIALDPTALPAD